MSNNETDSSGVDEASPPRYSEAEVGSMRQALEGLLPQIQQEATRQIGAKFVRAESASDFYQQTLATALEAAPGYRGTSNQELSAWLRQILLNHLRRSVRRAQSQVEQVNDAWESLIPSGDPSPS